VRGELVFNGDKVVGPPGHGRFLPREPYRLIEPRGRFSSPFNPVERQLLA
jgi:hypothetical protein